MSVRTPHFRQCTSPDCRFRFPAPGTREGSIPCPRCGSPAVTVRAAPESRDWNPREVKPPDPPVEALLDNIRSAYNVGSMFRTADGAGIQHLHLVGTTPTPDHPGVGKTALGAEFAVPWTYWTNGLEAAEQLQAHGYELWALEVGPRSVPLFESPPPAGGPPVVLVVGNEVSGVDPGIMELCDRLVWIPMQGYKRSLNVATAFGVAAYFLAYGNRIQSKYYSR